MSYASSSPNVTRKSPGLWNRFLTFLLPAPCLACQTLIDAPNKKSLGLCDACHALLIPWPETSCRRCGKLLQAAEPTPMFRCGGCRQAPPPFERLVSRYSYLPPLESVVLGFKFRRLDYLGHPLGGALLESLRQEHEFGRLNLDEIDLVTTVPLHWLRHLRRGYNQAWILAEPIATALDKPLVRLLRRRATAPQRQLGREERLTNLRRAFQPLRVDRARNKNVLLIDDVMTTGATLKAAATCLRRAGVRSIIAATVARTPDEREVAWLDRSRIRNSSDGPSLPANAKSES